MPTVRQRRISRNNNLLFPGRFNGGFGAEGWDVAESPVRGIDLEITTVLTLG